MYVIDIRFASLGLDCFWCWEISVFFFFFFCFLGGTLCSIGLGDWKMLPGWRGDTFIQRRMVAQRAWSDSRSERHGHSTAQHGTDL